MNQIIVQTNYGKLRGRVLKDYKERNYYSFQGIPYAKPPIGSLRFKAPLPPTSWKGIRNATTEGNVSVSRDEINFNIIGSEDCLYLNVYTPEFTKESSKLKSVLFYIHGGIFISGSGGTDILGPEYLMTENIILVTVNYRLGILGFLHLNDPSLEVPGNAALKDLVMALKWVNENIIYFSGDNRKITVAGHSAGSALAHLLMLSPMAKDLFQQIILQSGSAVATWACTSRESTELAKVLKFQNNNEKDFLEYLRSLTVHELIEAQDKLFGTSIIHKQLFCTAVVENSACVNTFITQHPVDIIKSGNYNKVPILLGYVSKEGLFTEVLYTDSKHENFEHFSDFQKMIPTYFNVSKNSELSYKMANKIEKYYYKDCKTDNEKLEKFYTMQTDGLILLSVYNTINIHQQNLNQPIYLYKVSYDTNLNYVKNKYGIDIAGTCHGDDLGYLFTNSYSKSLIIDKQHEKYIYTAIKLWANFIKTGNPNSKEQDELKHISWEPVKSNKYNFLHIDKKLKTSINLDFERMKFWDEISSMTHKQN